MTGQEEIEFENPVTFQGEKTSLLSSVSPRYGSRLGGETVRFTGTNFDEDDELYTITIDGIDCEVTAATSTYVECTTGARTATDTP